MHIDRYERIYIIATAAVLGVFFAALVVSAVVFGVRVPQPEGFINPRALSQTVFAQPGLRNLGDGRYEAYILAQMWSFNAGSSEKDERGRDILRVPQGATVTFHVTSADVTHGFIIERTNANIQLVPGHVGSTQHTFREPGTYHILCHEYCGRGHQSMVMSIIVEPTTS